MQLTSPAFQTGSTIPARFTCEGENISPEVSWQGAPPSTESFVLVLHDPDAPRQGGYTHWIVYNIPADVNHLPESFPTGEHVANYGMQGRNDAGRAGYMGPCPPSGSHRYSFRLYALKAELDLGPGVPYPLVLAKMKGRILAETELVGIYAKRSQKIA